MISLPPGYTAAPIDEALADAPGGQGFWATSADGLRLRLALWPTRGPRGTILLFPGRTEYIEKYGPTAADLADRGYHVLVIDWRGQGLSDRLLARREPGHVGQFSDYQTDVAAMVQAAHDLHLPQPWFLLAHSMGGAIGLRALMRHLPVQAAAFSAPMWGINLGGKPDWLVRAIAAGGGALGLGGRIAPGSSRQTLALTTGHAENLLTADPDQFARMQAHAQARPDIVLGGPSLRWVGQALAECRALASLSAPPIPALAGLGTAEGIVDPQAIRLRMRDWPEGRLVPYKDARHELMMEIPSTRARFLDAADTLFRTARA